MLPKVQLYSDGGSVPNPGKAGYGIILCYKDIKKEFKQGYILSTNNRMEMTGVIVGLSKLKTKSQVDIYTDSQYTINGIEKGWAKKWKENNWMRTKSQKAVNYDLWEKLLSLTQQHKVIFHWVKGHNGHIENERCDELATLALESDDLIEDEGFKTPHPNPLHIGEGVEGMRENYKQVPEYIKKLAKDLRKYGTDSEKILWEVFRNRKFNNLKFRRQHPFGRYIADFYCDEIKLVIELDGKIHAEEKQKTYDIIRDEIITKYGVKIIRIQNEDIYNNLTSIYKKVLYYIPSPLRRGVGGGDLMKKKNTNKISSPGDICGKCETAVIKKIPKKKKFKPEQKYYYEYFLFCPGCKTNYMIPEGKREIQK